MPDASPRAPTSLPGPEDLIAEEATCQVRSLMVFQITTADNTKENLRTSHLQDSLLDNIKQYASKDKTYQDIIKYIKNSFPKIKQDLDQQSQMYWNVRDELSYEDGLIIKGCQIVIPKEARKSVLQRLHDSHHGIVRTKRRARQTVFWPGMTSDIKNTVDSCEMCQIHRPS